MAENYIDTIVKKLYKLLKHPDIKKEVVAKSIGVTRVMLWKYSKGKSVTTESSIKKVEDAIRVIENKLSETSIGL